MLGGQVLMQLLMSINDTVPIIGLLFLEMFIIIMSYMGTGQTGPQCFACNRWASNPKLKVNKNQAGHK